MVRFEDLLEKVRAYSPDADVELLRKAYVFSALEHKGQVRHSGEPYLIHPLAVADFLADMKLDVVAIAAGLLHDVVEDTLTTIGRIRELFGSEVAHVVEGVTKISAIPFSTSEERQAENFRKMLLAMVDDIRVILVKLADRLHNMRTLNHLPEEKRVAIAQETRDIYAPIANRLGMSKVKNELEELSFRYLEPQVYEALRAQVDARRRATEGLIEQLKKTISTKLSEASVPVVEIDGRIKRLWSIHQKLKAQRIELDQVYDFIALRIVTTTVKDCYAALGIIHQTWSPVPGRIKDFIAMPRPNGYQSLHTSVISERGMPFEVQIRTMEMHRMAEEGIAAHWKYKEGRVGDQKDERYFQWMRQLLEYQQDVRDPQEFIQHLKIDLYPEEVYTFTPKGQVKAFPRGATPIDFAYSIHTDVGHQCVGARVNGKMVPLRAHLRNGDIVEIVTAAGHKPSRDWLNFVVTSHARYKIKHWIRLEERARAIELGRKVFEKEARRYDITLKGLQESEPFLKAQADTGAKTADDLFAQIGYGTLSAKQLLGRLYPGDRLREKPPDGVVTSVVRRAFGGGEERIKVSGADDVMVFRARCCNPIRGEKIVGYITRGKGVSVHSAACPNVLNLLYDPERRIAVEWDRSDGAAAAVSYTVKLTMDVEDRKGVLAAVSAKIADINTNIRNMEARAATEDQRARIDVTVEITDLKHLEKVIKALRGVSGVIEVSRAAGAGRLEG
ncbi:MAG TPA: bifunctional (p)ppGpp synthetase/guanosine-3',5'-bis(diphosphate) 3'-pyrophosphohydrolase [Vicinamibacterales bacterium]|jgi:GTP pyrophosphokinase|nr:bifunctional (p)ppGpp synthetase/guanosine-3',5'-bis(diphosphate) 3'-pyrophosphohydrolase [Vicinamibacterales bacterium]